MAFLQEAVSQHLVMVRRGMKENEAFCCFILYCVLPILLALECLHRMLQTLFQHKFLCYDYVTKVKVSPKTTTPLPFNVMTLCVVFSVHIPFQDWLFFQMSEKNKWNLYYRYSRVH